MWLLSRSSAAPAPDDAGATSEEEQLDQFKDAMNGMMHVLNDDLPSADAILNGGHSVFHLMGRGVALFIKGLLGFEAEVLRDAARNLLQAGNAAFEQRKKCMQDPSRSSVKLYPVGSEYLLCMEATQILRCILAILDTNVTETLKGFYNVRKAYQSFGSLVAVTDTHRSTGSTPPQTRTPATSTRGTSIRETAASSKTSLDPQNDDDEDEFQDAEGDLKPDVASSQMLNGHASSASSINQEALNGEALVSDVGSMNAVERFVHTGSSVGFGALLLGVSLVPSIFATLLKIVGFKGDRARGLELLWRGAEADSGYGSIGALILFEYYNAIGNFCEIVTEELYPQPRLERLLASMRSRFPDGRLWKIYEANFATTERDLDTAIKLVDVDSPSPLKQMQALQLYVHSIYCMYLHRYEDCRKGFEDGVALNERSHALSYYMAGVASVALYRETDTTEARDQYAEDVSRLFDLALKSAGKKRFLSKPIPFEVFIIHKINKWKARAQAEGVRLIDAVGTSPMDEAIYFWNGYKRLSISALEKSLANIEREAAAAAEADDEYLDEKAIRLFVKAIILRNLGKPAEAKELLREVVSMEQDTSRDGLQDNWMQPLACYETAVTLWSELDGSSEDDARLKECLSLIEKVDKWESFHMQEAFGIQLNISKESIQSRITQKATT